MNITVLILLIFSPTVWSQSAARTSADGLLDVASALDPGLSNGDMIRAMDAVMGGNCQRCNSEGPEIDNSCRVIPTSLADRLVASRGIYRIFGTENSRVCGALALREGVSIEDMMDLSRDYSYSPDDNQITIQDPARGDIRLSVNQFGIGVRINTDDIAEGSNFRIGADNNSVGGTIKIPIGRRGH